MTKRMRRAFFHVPKHVPYSIENSFIGLWAAWLLRILWIDIDLQITKDGVVVAAHWAHPKDDGFILPPWFTKKYGNNPRIANIEWADLKQLRTGVRTYKGKTFTNQYRTLREMMAEAKRRGRRLELEAKGDPRLALPQTWAQVDADRAAVGLPKDHVQVKTLTSIPGALRRLQAAHPHFTTILLPRDGFVVPRSAESYIDYVRGSWKRGPVGS